MMKSTGIFVVVALIASACTQSSANGGRASDAGSQQADWAAIVRLEDQAKAIARTSGCSSASRCRSAPVGNRACGGPRYYIAYCSTSTDSAALFRKLDEVTAAENAYNRTHQIASTCEFRMPGPITVAGGECQIAGQ